MDIQKTGSFARISYQGSQTSLEVLKVDGRLVFFQPDTGKYLVAVSGLEELESILNIASMVDAV